MQGGYETGLETALSLAGQLADKFPLELMVAGRVSRARLQMASQKKSRVPTLWAGLVPGAQIPALARSAHLLYPADSMPPARTRSSKPWLAGCRRRDLPPGRCPNWSPEIPAAWSHTAVIPGSWKNPISPRWPLLPRRSCRTMLLFRKSARLRAEQAFGLDAMLDRYLDVLLG